MGYIQAATDHLKENAPHLSSNWGKVVANVRQNYPQPAEDVRDLVVGTQGEYDDVFASMDSEAYAGVAVVMTNNVSTPFIYNAFNIHEIEEAKRASVAKRIVTSRDMLKNGKVVVIAAPKAAWDKIEDTSQGKVFEGLEADYPNHLYRATVEIPEGMSGAVNISIPKAGVVETDYDVPKNLENVEATSINFTQAQKDSPEISGRYLIAGSIQNPIVKDRVIQFLDPLTKVKEDAPRQIGAGYIQLLELNK